MACVQRPISIPEPVNEVDSLWVTTKALKEAVEVIQGIRGNREYALVCDTTETTNDLQNQINNIVTGTGGSGATKLNELSDVGSVAYTPSHVLVADGVNYDSRLLTTADISGLGPTVSTFAELTDTDVPGVATYDMLYWNSTDWVTTLSELIWNPDFDYMQLANSHSINWLDSVGASTELLVLDVEGTGGAPAPDPDIGSVVLLASLEDATTGLSVFAPEIGGAFTAVETGAGVAEVSEAQAKFGTKSLRALDFTGPNSAYWQADAVSADYGFGTGDFTIEYHVYFVANITPFHMAIWDFGTDASWYITQTTTTLGDFRTSFGWSSTGTNSLGGTQSLWGHGAFATWYHVAICRENTSLHVWVDGVAAGAPKAISGSIHTSTTLPLQLQGGRNDGANAETFIDNIRITKGVARYTTAFTPPDGPYDGSSGDFESEVFVVGDPAYDTRIDGLTTTITAAITTINGTLGVDGDTSLNSGASLTFWDSTDTDSAVFSHDGADFNTAFTGTTDWDISGLTGRLTSGIETYAYLSEVPIGGASLIAQYRFDTSIVEADPGNGSFRMDNVTPASVTEIFVSSTTDNNNDFDNILSFISPGDQIYIQQGNDAARYILLDVTANVDNTGWYSIAGTIAASGALFAGNGKCHILVLFGGTNVISLGDLSDVDLTGATDNDLLFRSGGNWLDTAGALTWDGSVLNVTGALGANDAAGPTMLNEAATSVNPTLIPNRANESTGIGWAATDQLSMIAGDIEAIRYSEASSHVLADSQVHTGITAGTTQTQADGFQLLSSHNEVATVATTNDTVVAPLAVVGRFLTILNNGANTLQIFPAVGDDLGAGVDTAITLAAAGKLWFVAYDATTWTQFV